MWSADGWSRGRFAAVVNWRKKVFFFCSPLTGICRWSLTTKSSLFTSWLTLLPPCLVVGYAYANFLLRSNSVATFLELLNLLWLLRPMLPVSEWMCLGGVIWPPLEFAVDILPLFFSSSCFCKCMTYVWSEMTWLYNCSICESLSSSNLRWSFFDMITKLGSSRLTVCGRGYIGLQLSSRLDA